MTVFEKVQQVLEHGEFVSNSLSEIKKVVNEGSFQGYNFHWDRLDQNEYVVFSAK